MARIFFTQEQSPAIGDFEFEIIESESHSRSSQAPTYPVEQGNEISDHIINDPEEFSVSGFVSNTPVTGDPTDAVNAAYDALIGIHNSRATVDIVSGLQVYTSMHMSSLGISRDSSSGESLRFNASFRKIRIVSSREVEVNIEQLGGDEETQSQAEPEIDQGRVSPNEAVGLTR